MTEGEQVDPETDDAQEAQDEYAWQPDQDESYPVWESTDWTPAQETQDEYEWQPDQDESYPLWESTDWTPAQEAQDEYDWQPDPDESYLLWESTDWTPAQRTTAIRGLLLLALGGGLIAGCLAVWQTASFAATLLAPIGMTLVCWGVTHLNTLSWYAYWNDATTTSEQRRKVWIMVAVITVESFVDVGTLGLQLVGVAVTAVAAAVGLAGWRGFDPFVLAWVISLPMVVGVVVNLLGFVTWTSNPWRPRRDPAASDSAVGMPARGIRLLLRWVVMAAATAIGPVLVIVPPLILFDSYLALSHESPDPQLPKLAALFGLGAALCLILALSELTNPERATTLGAA